MNQIVQIVRHYSQVIDNGRTLRSILDHARGEIDELAEEITKVEKGEEESADGVVGEAIDVIACALDAIFTQRPDITDEELNAIMTKKCKKWANVYANSPRKQANGD